MWPIASTKGGVGKTTIATQLSCCLALTSYGRGRFQTCLVDFDTSFGDVCTSLDCDMNGVNIVTWIKDIRLRVKNGEELQEMDETERVLASFLGFHFGGSASDTVYPQAEAGGAEERRTETGGSEESEAETVGREEMRLKQPERV